MNWCRRMRRSSIEWPSEVPIRTGLFELFQRNGVNRSDVHKVDGVLVAGVAMDMHRGGTVTRNRKVTVIPMRVTVRKTMKVRRIQASRYPESKMYLYSI